MPLAIYDLDETLINADCSLLWLQFLIDKGLTDPAIMDDARHLDHLYHQGELDMHHYVALQLRPHIGQTLAEATREIDLFIREYVQPCIRPSAVESIRRHKARGERCLVISASIDFLVEPIAAHLGIEDAIGVRIELDQGRITGRADGPICFQEGKVLHLNRWLEQQGENTEGSWFYSDSHNDLPLLEQVDFPVGVSPDTRLANVCKQRGWAIVNWECAK